MAHFNRIVRSFLRVGLQIACIPLASFLAFVARFDGDIPTQYVNMYLHGLASLIIIRGVTFLPFGMYRSSWRYSDVRDLRNIITATTVSTLLFVLVTEFGLGLRYPRSVLVCDAIFLICLLGGARLCQRMVTEWRRPGAVRHVLVYGAGNAGERLVVDMQRSRPCTHKPIGFIDDDIVKTGVWIHGVPVLGTGSELASILERENPDEIVVAMTSAPPARIRAIVKTLEPFKIPIKTLPRLADIMDGKVTVNDIRALAVEDLLPRPPVQMDLTPVQHFLKGKRVVVTGAGGSIGSELCRQIARCEPAMLFMLDKAESALYDIDMELRRTIPACPRTTLLVDITHTSRLRDVFMQHAPQIVFHAAAYKHVPMMEMHPSEAVLNNVIGSQRLCEIAAQSGVETFVQISTDKAVNPTNVMGATKRTGELFLQALAQNPEARGQTTFCAVRFGNVLGSNGSVVPLFLQQIRQGGPVTVTHPDITRYFMTIPEASQLVLRAATLAKGGEIFVLDMGEQIRVLDMARHLIRLSGAVPDDDIAITFTGLRPGEKLYEELVGADETVEPSGEAKIDRVCPQWRPDLERLSREFQELEWLAKQGRSKAILALLREIVPTFCSLDTVTDTKEPEPVAPVTVSPFPLHAVA